MTAIGKENLAQGAFKYDTINTFHEDNFTCSFSNFPVIEETLNELGVTQPVDMDIFDLYVKDVTIPDQGLLLDEMSYLNRIQLQPMSKGNSRLNAVVVDFMVDASFLNYFLIYTYIRQMREGLAPVDIFYKNVIHEMFVDLHANRGDFVTRLKFKDLFPVSTGSLILTSGKSDTLTFAVSFLYNDFTVELIREGQVAK